MQAEKLLQKKLQSKIINHSYLLICNDANILQKQIELIVSTCHIKNTNKIVIEPEEKRNGIITIEAIRILKSELSKKASYGKRLVVINRADRFNTQSANAFLKTLEEPPQDTIIVLLCPNDDLLETIKSRCQRYYFPNTPVSTNFISQIEIENLKNKSLKELFAFADSTTKNGNADKLIWDLTIYYLNQAKKQSSKGQVLEILMDAKHKLSFNTNARVVIENLFLNLRETVWNMS